MNLRQLRYFCEIVDAGSAAAAAERLHVAPTAISMQLAQLEGEVGGELFDRSHRPMQPTMLGQFLYPRAKELLSTAARLAEDVRAVAQGSAGWLAVGYTRSTIFSILPRAVRAFREAHPQVHLELIAMLSEHQREALLSGRIQLGIARYTEPPAPDPALIHSPLFADRFCLALPPQHRLASRPQVTTIDIAGVPLVTYPKDGQSRFAERTLEMLRRAGIEPIVACEALEIHTALGLVAAGLGGSLVARSVSIGSRKDIAFVDIADLVGDASTVFAVTAAGTPDKLLGALLELLHAVGRDLGSELATGGGVS